MLYFEWLAPLAILLFGLVFGSFANVVIWRFPRGESLSSPGSQCPSCDAPIRWHDNVPVVAWIALRGRCRDCSARIHWRYPVVELLSGSLWLLAWWRFGLSFQLAFAVMLFYMLLILSFIDLDTMRLPNALVALLAFIGISGVALSYAVEGAVLPLLGGQGTVTPALWAGLGVLAGSSPALLMSVAYLFVRGAQGLGMGDVKLLAALGLFLGPYAVLVLFLGSVIGVVAVVVASKNPGVTTRIPFGPSLAVAAVLVAVWGVEIVGWYVALL